MESKKSNRGGRREGAGRKPTSREIKKNAIDIIAVWRKGKRIEPIQVMLEAMESTYNDSGALAAFALAKDIAPYMTARLTSGSVDYSNELNKQQLERAKIETQIKQLELTKILADVGGENKEIEPKTIVFEVAPPSADVRVTIGKKRETE